jgi:Flp pilus assembly protein TadG
MVTAETALAIPALVAVVVALAWLLSLGLTQGVVAQAAREGARAAARGESAAAVRSAAWRVAPDAAVTIRRAGATVSVTASVRRTPPIRLLRPLGREVRASATSWREDT